MWRRGVGRKGAATGRGLSGDVGGGEVEEGRATEQRGTSFKDASSFSFFLVSSKKRTDLFFLFSLSLFYSYLLIFASVILSLVSLLVSVLTLLLFLFFRRPFLFSSFPICSLSLSSSLDSLFSSWVFLSTRVFFRSVETGTGHTLLQRPY